MTSLITFLALLFGGIAVWAGMHLLRGSRKPKPRPRSRPAAPANEPSDPWGVGRMRRGERYSVRVTPRRS